MIEELIAMAKTFKEDLEGVKGANGLTPEESAFYDALAQNKSAQEVMAALLLEMSREVAKKLRENVTVDWAVETPSGQGCIFLFATF